MAAESGADHFRLGERQIIGLPDVVEIAGLEHHVMDAVLAGLDEGETVMARIDVEEISPKWLLEIIAQLEIEDFRIERNDLVDPLRGEHGMAHAERSGAEARNGAARLERLVRDLGAMKRFEQVAERIGEHDQILDAPLVGKRRRAA